MITALTAVEVAVITLVCKPFCQNPDFWLWSWPSNSDFNPLSSWVDWQRIDITPSNYNQSIEFDLSFLNHHSSLSYYYYNLRYGGLGQFGREWVMRVIHCWSSDGDWSYSKGSIVFSIEIAFNWATIHLPTTTTSRDIKMPCREAKNGTQKHLTAMSMSTLLMHLCIDMASSLPTNRRQRLLWWNLMSCRIQHTLLFDAAANELTTDLSFIGITRRLMPCAASPRILIGDNSNSTPEMLCSGREIPSEWPLLAVGMRSSCKESFGRKSSSSAWR